MEIKKKGNDKDRSGITFDKLLQLLKLFLPKYSKTFMRLNKFSDLDMKKVDKKAGTKIKGIITDVDECISLNRAEILPQNIKHLKELLKQGYPIALLSNMERTNRYDILPKEIKIITNYQAKPHPQGFKKALKTLGLSEDEVLMIGDNYITDGGAIPLGIRFVKVKPIFSTNESFPFRILRQPMNFMRWLYDWLSRKYEKMGG